MLLSNSQRPSAKGSFEMPDDIWVLILSGRSSEVPLGSLFHLYTLSISECCYMKLRCRILTHALYGFIVSPSLVKGTPCSSICSTVDLSPPLFQVTLPSEVIRIGWENGGLIKVFNPSPEAEWP